MQKNALTSKTKGSSCKHFTYKISRRLLTTCRPTTCKKLRLSKRNMQLRLMVWGRILPEPALTRKIRSGSQKTRVGSTQQQSKMSEIVSMKSIKSRLKLSKRNMELRLVEWDRILPEPALTRKIRGGSQKTRKGSTRQQCNTRKIDWMRNIKSKSETLKRIVAGSENSWRSKSAGLRQN